MAKYKPGHKLRAKWPYTLGAHGDQEAISLACQQYWARFEKRHSLKVHEKSFEVIAGGVNGFTLVTRAKVLMMGVEPDQSVPDHA